MQQFIILFKAVNVGGKNLLPMKELVALLQQKNYQDVSSYIQSGNVVLKCKSNPTVEIKTMISDHYGFSPEIFLLNEAELSMIVDKNPYKQYEGKLVHFYFCQNEFELIHDKLTNTN